MSSGATAAVRSRATVSPVSAPRLRRSASVIAPSASPDSTTTCSSSGSCSRTDAIFAACAASSSSTTFAPLWESTYSHSSDEFVWYTGTTTAPAQNAPKSAIVHSGTVPHRIATGSPVSTPSEARPPAISRIARPKSAYVMVDRPGARIASPE